MNRIFGFTLAILTASAIACSRPAAGPRRFVENGVEVVDNGAGIYRVAGQPSALALREEFAIDLADPKLAESGLKNVYSLKVDSHGHVFVNNGGFRPGHGLFEFDERGRFVRPLVRIGQGPGEYQDAALLGTVEDDELPVLETSRGRISVLGPDGRLIRTVEWKPPADMAQPRRQVLLSGGSFIAMYVPIDPAERTFRGFETAIFDSRFKVAVSLGRFGWNLSSSEFPAGYPVFTATRTAVFSGSWGSNEIAVHDPAGRPVRVIRSRFPPVAISPEFVARMRERYPVNHPGRAMVWPRVFPPYQALVADDEGRVYAVGFERDDRGMTRCDVFAPDGTRFLRTGLGYQDFERQAMGVGVDPVIRKRRLYCVREKDDGFLEVVVFRMTWS